MKIAIEPVYCTKGFKSMKKIILLEFGEVNCPVKLGYPRKEKNHVNFRKWNSYYFK